MATYLSGKTSHRLRSEKIEIMMFKNWQKVECHISVFLEITGGI